VNQSYSRATKVTLKCNCTYRLAYTTYLQQNFQRHCFAWNGPVCV